MALAKVDEGAKVHEGSVSILFVRKKNVYPHLLWLVYLSAEFKNEAPTKKNDSTLPSKS